MARCTYKACVSPAVEGSELCGYHRNQNLGPTRPAPQPAKLPAADEDFGTISITDIPPPRVNEVAVSVLQAFKTLPDGKALKVRLRRYPKPCLMTTQRYALTEGLRIGIRWTEEWAYLWRMTAEQVQQAEAKAERLKTARAKKKK